MGPRLASVGVILLALLAGAFLAGAVEDHDAELAPLQDVLPEDDAGPHSPVKKTGMAGFVDKVLDKEFHGNDDSTAHQHQGSAGRSFNDTHAQHNGTLETVVRVSSSSKAEAEAPLGPGEATIGSFLRALERKLQPMSLVGGGGGGEHSDAVERLVDQNDNEFVMSNPKGGSMELQHDNVFLNDIMGMIFGAAVGGCTCGALGQPVITGYLLAGAAMGPGGLGLVNGLVQVETLAQLGVMLMLFTLGIEFSLAKLRNVKGAAMGGGAIQILLFMALGGTIATWSGAPMAEGVFVGAFLSMSSTTVVLKCLMDRQATHTLYGQLTLGTLILQDIAIGLLFALLPVLAGTSGWVDGSVTVVRELIVMAAFVVVSAFAARVVMPRLVRVLIGLGARAPELHMLGAVSICFTVAAGSDRLGLSTELGAFVAGVLVSSADPHERTLHVVEPVRNLFVAFFMVSIGMIMNPVFLYMHMHALVATLTLVVVAKSSLIALVVRVFGYSPMLSLSVGVSLAQIGEFAFVLLSRASALGLVQRNWYLLLLGTTAVSLITTPMLFRMLPYALKIAIVMRWIPRDGDMDPNLGPRVSGRPGGEGGSPPAGGGGSPEGGGGLIPVSVSPTMGLAELRHSASIHERNVIGVDSRAER